jgi:hypothetical protein
VAHHDVQVHGSGLLARLLTLRLAEAGVDVARVADPPEAGGELFAGLVLPCHPEHPHRFLGALGLVAARELLTWAEPARAALPGLHSTGLDVVCAGPDADAAAPALAAAKAMGLAAEDTAGGYRLLGGGRRAGPLAGEPAASPAGTAEVNVWACAAVPNDPWFRDKLSAVRWHGVALPGVLLPRPRVSRQFTVFADAGYCWGARWAEIHMGVGDGLHLPASKRVVGTLARLVGQDFAVSAGEVHTLLAAESCDGLPIVGPLPGRPREIALAGFGIVPAVWGPAAVEAVANGILGRSEGWTPAGLRASRFT